MTDIDRRNFMLLFGAAAASAAIPLAPKLESIAVDLAKGPDLTASGLFVKVKDEWKVIGFIRDIVLDNDVLQYGDDDGWIRFALSSSVPVMSVEAEFASEFGLYDREIIERAPIMARNGPFTFTWPDGARSVEWSIGPDHGPSIRLSSLGRVDCDVDKDALAAQIGERGS